MKLKLAALLSLITFALAGCSGESPSNTATTNNAASPPASASSSPATTAQNNPNMVEASANPTATTGGTKEGCKCSAVGMACNTKEGEKGCCGGKDGACSLKKDGVSSCCSMGKDGEACCSMAKSMASADHKDMKGMSNDKSTEKKSDAAPGTPTKKS